MKNFTFRLKFSNQASEFPYSAGIRLCISNGGYDSLLSFFSRTIVRPNRNWKEVTCNQTYNMVIPLRSTSVYQDDVHYYYYTPNHGNVDLHAQTASTFPITTKGDYYNLDTYVSGTISLYGKQENF